MKNLAACSEKSLLSCVIWVGDNLDMLQRPLSYSVEGGMAAEKPCQETAREFLRSYLTREETSYRLV